MNKDHVVGIADMKIAKDFGTLVTFALGSCVGVCLYDTSIKLGAMVHIMLPESPQNYDSNHFRYADTAIPHTLKKMESMGANKYKIVCKIAGGASMFDISDNSIIGNIGQRNIERTRDILRKEGLKIIGEDVGANYARTLYFDVNTGVGKIKTFGRPEVSI